jgi:hypothetical protein
MIPPREKTVEDYLGTGPYLSVLDEQLRLLRAILEALVDCNGRLEYIAARLENIEQKLPGVESIRELEASAGATPHRTDCVCTSCHPSRGRTVDDKLSKEPPTAPES